MTAPVFLAMVELFSIRMVTILASAGAAGMAVRWTATHGHGRMARKSHYVRGLDAHEDSCNLISGNHLDAAAALLKFTLPFSHVLALLREFDAE